MVCLIFELGRVAVWWTHANTLGYVYGTLFTPKLLIRRKRKKEVENG